MERADFHSYDRRREIVHCLHQNHNCHETSEMGWVKGSVLYRGQDGVSRKNRFLKQKVKTVLKREGWEETIGRW